MLNQRIENKGIMHMVACQLRDDLRERLGIYNNYDVEKVEDEDSANVLVYSDRPCNILTCACIESVMEVLNCYLMMYGGISYHFGTIEKGEGEEKRILPCVYVRMYVDKK